MNREGREEREGGSSEIESLARVVVDACLKVHKALGPGLLESAYEHCLAYELNRRNITVRRQVALPVVYEGVALEAGFRIDLLVADQVIIEVKAVEAMSALHEAQLLTYLKLSRLRLGFLMNFNVLLFKDGLKRRVLNL